MGETPEAPEHIENEHAHFKYWTCERGANNFRGTIPAVEGIKPMTEGTVGTDHLLFTGKNVNVPYCTVYGDSDWGARLALYRENINQYLDLSFIYMANYDFDLMKVSVKQRSFGNVETQVDHYVRYGNSIDYIYAGTPAGKKFVGYADEEGGEAVYKNYRELPKALADVTYYAVYTADKFKVDLEYFDEDTLSYKTYKTLTVEGGEKIPEEEMSALRALYKAPDGVEYTFYRVFDVLHKMSFNTENIVTSDLSLRIDLARTVSVTLDEGDGELTTGNKVWNTYSSGGYKLTLGDWAKKEADDYNTYTLAGWQNSETGEIYAVGQPCVFEKPVTLRAVYKSNAKTYTVTVNTPYGVLKNGKQNDSFNGGYDDYLKFMAVYDNWLPATVTDVDYTRTCTTSRYQYSVDKQSVEITFIWKNTINQYTVSLDPNGGTVSGISEFDCDYGTELDLTDIFIPKKSDLLCDYEIAGWKDQYGNEYAADGKLTVKGDITLSPVWKEGVYKEYSLIHIVDGKIVNSEKKHYGDTLTDPDVPKEAAGLAFSGWKWQDAAGNDIERPDTMPAETLTVYGTTTKCYVTYKVNGDIVSGPTFTSVGSIVTVDSKYETEGNTVTDWTTEDADVTNGSFVMPDHDVTFTASAEPNEYTIAVDIEGKKTSYKAKYGTVFTLPEQPKREGYTFFWTADDSDVQIITEDGVSTIYVPARDVTLTGEYTQSVHNIYYVLNGEIVADETIIDVPYGQTDIYARYYPDNIPQGKEFTGWLTDDVDLSKEGGFTMPDRDVYFCGEYVDAGSIAVEIFTKRLRDEYDDPEIPELDLYGRAWTLYCEPGGELTLPSLERDGCELTWKIHEDFAGIVTIKDGKISFAADADISYLDIYAVFTEKKAG